MNFQMADWYETILCLVICVRTCSLIKCHLMKVLNAGGVNGGVVSNVANHGVVVNAAVVSPCPSCQVCTSYCLRIEIVTLHHFSFLGTVAIHDDWTVNKSSMLSSTIFVLFCALSCEIN